MDRLQCRNVGGDDVTFRTDALARDLAPAARCGTEIENAAAPLQKVEAIVEFDKLKGGTRAIALGLSGAHKRIVQLTLEPFVRRCLARFRILRLEPDFAATRRAPRHRERSARSSRRIASRKPRSATRSSVHGQSSRIAAKIAHPGRMRSARSAPTQPSAARPARSRPATRSITATMSSERCQLASTRSRL